MWLFIYTPVVSTLGVVGDNGLISTETLLDNVLPDESDVSSDELLLRYYMNRRGDDMVSAQTIITALKKMDSLENELVLWRAYAQNIKDVVAYKTNPLVADSLIAVGRAIGSSDESQRLLDSVLRERTTDPLSEMNKGVISVFGRKLYPPLKGRIEQSFSHEKGIYSIIINGVSGVVTSTDDGTVVSSEWTSAHGYVMQVQHKNNLISIYKGVKKPIKEIGAKVAAREVIGYLNLEGVQNKNAANRSNVIFELWENGFPIDPERYIVF